MREEINDSWRGIGFSFGGNSPQNPSTFSSLAFQHCSPESTQEMAEQSSVSKHSIEIGRPKNKLIVPSNRMESMKSLPSSVPSSPSGQAKSAKYNCLCSPTTHAGSFRCRYHRTSSLTRNSMSVGSKLSELAAEK
ncbi:hypothetical protein HAX54_023335 [Datura stramonium]|uniref:Uncharacterized protein n=1 Tax=Datura stramonium TaxID=4076 RepID=A0ABS8UY41_DATST|nr:hypothetical protein [Datura stramonium]